MAVQKPQPEELFGPYEVYERLGVGGMATVHRAKERGIEGFERVVALKRLLPHLAEDASFVRSFVREAKLASMLQHVNIVQIYELGRVGTQYFISMEYISGKDLRQVLRHTRKVTGAAPMHITVGILLQLCDALDYAHTKTDENGQPLQLVHRDVSPSNLILTQSGHLKVIDFGIAKAQSIHHKTQTGNRVKGKLAYMAPEAIAGRDLDARSDLFAVGIIAHELITARPLFASKNDYQTILKIQRGDVLPPSTFNQACPPELDAIVAQALARDVDQRFESAADLREALTALRHQYQLPAGPREIAAWLSWAFSLDAPSTSFALTTSESGFTSNSAARSGTHAASTTRTPPRGSGARPPSLPPARAQTLTGPPGLIAELAPRAHSPGAEIRAEEEEAVAAVWGAAELEERSAPVVLDDVPDVSAKMRMRSTTGSLPPSTAVLPDDALVLLDEQTSPGDGVASRARRSGRISASLPLPADPNEAWPVETTTGNTGRNRSGSFGGVTGSGFGGGTSNRSRTFGGGTGSGNRSATFEGSSQVRHTASFGAAMVERNSTPKWRAALAAVVVLGGAGGAAYWWMNRPAKLASTAAATANAPSEIAQVKIVTEPADATIKLGELAPQQGSPYATSLAPGVYQLEVHKDGFKSYLSSVELVGGEKQTVRVALVASTPQSTASTLKIDSQPSDAAVLLDGMDTGLRTPAMLEVKPGPHVVVLRQNGEIRWKQQFTVEANSTAEFNATLTDDRRQWRLSYEANGASGNRPAPAVVTAPRPATTRTTEAPAQAVADKPRTPLPPVTTLNSVAIPITPTHATNPLAPVAPTPPTAAAGKPSAIPPSVTAPRANEPTLPVPNPGATGAPPVIRPDAVSRVAGELPRLANSTASRLPTTIAAKLCIDSGGRVTSSHVLSRVDDDITETIGNALRTWRYTPYRSGGTPSPACFVVTFRIR